MDGTHGTLQARPPFIVAHLLRREPAPLAMTSDALVTLILGIIGLLATICLAFIHARGQRRPSRRTNQALDTSMIELGPVASELQEDKLRADPAQPRAPNVGFEEASEHDSKVETAAVHGA